MFNLIRRRDISYTFWDIRLFGLFAAPAYDGLFPPSLAGCLLEFAFSSVLFDHFCFPPEFSSFMFNFDLRSDSKFVGRFEFVALDEVAGGVRLSSL